MNELCAKRVLIAASGSNSGKTTITCALLELLKREGLEPLSFKCGPDYIDPMFHKKVLGIESRNLDSFFSGSKGVRRILAEYGECYAVIEGVMGIYDGIRTDSTEGSAYEIAVATSTPVILVVDASGTGRTVISLIKGILLDDTAGLIKGILLNNIREHFYVDLKPVLEKELAGIRDDVALLGFFPRDRELSIGSRHLGLKLPGEIEDIKTKIDASASLLEKCADSKKILSIMEKAERTEAQAEDRLIIPEVFEEGKRCRLAVAYDEAFCFYYRDNLKLFEKLGAELCYFSPLKDKAVPEDADGILLGGGYPENYLKELSANHPMLDSIRNAIGGGMPSLAECGGFMYLHRSITAMGGVRYEMAGVVDGECEYTGKLVRFGYMEIESVADPELKENELIKSLEGMRGHEFHYYDSSNNGAAYLAKKPYKDIEWNCIIYRNNGIWGFPHFYYPSKPEFVIAFIKAMKERAHG